MTVSSTARYYFCLNIFLGVIFDHFSQMKAAQGGIHPLAKLPLQASCTAAHL